MAKKKSDKQPRKVAERERPAPEPEEESPAPQASGDELALAKREESGEDEGGSEGQGEGEGEGGAGGEGTDLLALRRDVEQGDLAKGEDEGAAPAQLGTERYVLAGFFAFGMLAAYILGKFVHGVWSYLSNKDWFSQTFPRLAAVADDDKTSIGLVIGAIASVFLVLRTYRRPDIRTWSDDVAGELAKVNWPDKKEVSNSTIVVIAATTVATIYLALLDRLWGFVTNLIYGDGS